MKVNSDPTQPQEKNTQGFSFIRLVAWLVGFVFFCIVSSTLGLYLLCFFKSEEVCAFVESQLYSITEMHWRLESAHLALSPTPALSFSSVAVFRTQEALKLNEPLFSSGRLEIRPDIIALLMGQAGIKRIILESPVFQILEAQGKMRPVTSEVASAHPVRPHASTPPANASSKNASLPPADLSTHLAPAVDGMNATAQLDKEPLNKEQTTIFADATSLHQVENEGGHPPVVDARQQQAIKAASEFFASAKEYLTPQMRGRLSRLTVRDGRCLVLNMQRETEVEVSNVALEFRSGEAKKSSLKAHVFLPSVGLAIDVASDFSLPGEDAPDYCNGTIALHSIITPPDSRGIPISLRTDINWRRSDDTVHFTNFMAESEGDQLVANMFFSPATGLVNGQAEFSQLSLPRWFYFARNLPPGLQEPLHALSGTLDFTLSPFSAHGENVIAHAGPFTITGSVGADDFSTPVVDVNLAIGIVDLDDIFPFLSAGDKERREPIEPLFSMPYLIPFPGPLGDDAPDVGYNVNIHSPGITVHSIKGGPLDVAIYPMGGNVTRVALDAKSIADGAISGEIDIDRPLVLMKYKFKGVELGHLPENIDSPVIFKGKATGEVKLSIDVHDGEWVDDWKLTADGAITNQAMTLTTGGKWSIYSGKMDVKGNGIAQTNRAKGIKLTGTWETDAHKVSSSWFKNGNESIHSVLKGTLAWPVASAAKKTGQKQSKGISHVFGDLTSSGRLTVPLGEQLVPLEGTLASPMDWKVDDILYTLNGFTFEGHSSIAKGTLTIEGSGKETVVNADTTYKIAPRKLLADWKLLPEAVQVPQIMIGRTKFKAQGATAVFSDLNLQADGAPFKGTVTITQPEGRKKKTKNLLIDMDMTGERVDFDNIIPPTPEAQKHLPPSTTPWDLSIFKGIDLNARMKIANARFRKVNTASTEIDGNMTDGRFKMTALSTDFYGGRSTTQLMGVLDAIKSTITLERAYVVLKAVALSGLFNDAGDDSKGHYGGIADLVLDVNGKMANNADFPAALSGRWSMEVRDGIFPAFLGSETAGLRNTFSRASLSGEMDKGVMKSKNFVLTGTMVDMTGEGWVNLGKRTLDISAKVTLASVPTVPVRFTGTLDKMVMHVSGGNMVIDTASQAGSSIFNLFKGIIYLPARAVRGVNSLFSSDSKVKKTVYEPIKEDTRPQSGDGKGNKNRLGPRKIIP